ncbi:MAG: hypothetical protein KGH57_04670 [Candidatus Micrarchaeota archaeon]|nr:hypothetical protein [Candidatus Micrarchaeota archaeon]
MAKTGAEKAKQQKSDKKTDDKKEAKRQAGNLRTALMIAAPIVLAFAIFFIVILPTLTVPFSTFKSNFLAGSRVALVAVYNSTFGAAFTLQCATQLVQVVAHSRNATSIDFYVFSGSTCTYPVGGLGHAVSLATNTIGNCLSMTGGEPTLFLNYSQANSTRITPYRLYVSGNAEYMAKCPIAVDLS